MPQMMLISVLELAHVARPGVRRERGERAASSSTRRWRLRGARRSAKCSREQRDVLAALAQRRQRRPADHVEPVVQVLAEAPRLDLVGEVAVGRGDDARTSTRRASSCRRPADLALLQHAQQLGLQLERQLADLVEEQRAAVGLLEQAARARAVGAGERAAHVAEQLALDSSVSGSARS